MPLRFFIQYNQKERYFPQKISEEDCMKLKVGETIKRLRKEREITQEEFAEVLGVSCQSVSRWEKGGSFS